jgi:protocatechuate 3,4-dioxygenase beta subunit
VAGVKVLLLDANGTPTGASAVTDGSGSYSFSNLKPGTYSVPIPARCQPITC